MHQHVVLLHYQSGIVLQLLVPAEVAALSSTIVELYSSFIYLYRLVIFEVIAVIEGDLLFNLNSNFLSNKLTRLKWLDLLL